MPQIFQVLRCYKCAVFQVHQTRKDNKWVCKLCGEKQSVKRHYGLGTGKDCRIHVQKLNKMRGEKEELLTNRNNSEDSEYDENVDNNLSSNDNDKIILPQNVNKESKWSVYVDKTEEVSEVSRPEYLNGTDVLLDVPQKRKVKRKYYQMKSLEDSVYSDDDNDDCKFNTNSQLKNKINFLTNVGHSNLKSCSAKNEDTLNSNMFIESQISTNITKQHEKLHIQPLKINKNSKWSQYIDNEDIEETDRSTEKNDRKQIFALCDDSEIDTILDL